jgi:flagellar biosynthesis activator protein FlaF
LITQHGTQAYRAVAKEIASPRELEASLLLKAAARLQAVVDGWDQNRSDLDGALLYNRKLWTVFLGSAMSDDNPLPVEIRQNVANLGMYIMSQTIAVTSNPQPEIVRSLVNINRELAAGLRGQG